MGRKKKPAHETPNISAHWVRSETFTINGRNVQPGTELSIRGERGRFRFMQHVYNPTLDVEWIDVVGGPKGVKQMRAFRPEKVRRVHWKNKLRENPKK